MGCYKVNFTFLPRHLPEVTEDNYEYLRLASVRDKMVLSTAWESLVNGM
jgi:hypothetical protein